MKNSSNASIDTWLGVAVEASKAASHALLDRFRPAADSPLEVNYKGPADVVTDADITSDKAIADVLSRPGVPGDILSEESRIDKGDGQLTWLIDPLCGTLPFSTGLPHWGVCIALSSEPDLLVGVVALPTTGEVLSAAKGKGAFLNGNPFEAHEPPGTLRDIGVALADDSQGYSNAQRTLRSAIGRGYSFGSAAYPMAQVLLGRMHGVVFKRGLSVHTAAGVVIARELGVRVTDVAGNDVVWDPEAPRNGMVFAWPQTHDALLDALRD
jgi:myo-inositol-1(or 4)-monophosphatase